MLDERFQRRKACAGDASIHLDQARTELVSGVLTTRRTIDENIPPHEIRSIRPC